MLLWEAALWAVGVAAAVGVIALWAGLAACEAVPPPWVHNHEEFRHRCFEERGRVNRAIERSGHTAAWTRALVLVG